MNYKLYLGDCFAFMETLENDSMDAIICDPLSLHIIFPDNFKADTLTRQIALLKLSSNVKPVDTLHMPTLTLLGT